VWLEGLRDWNISRQLWWGHRIPVWYCADGHQFAAIEDPTSCAVCGSAAIEQDPDVLDTWFSSQLWPFSTLGWPDPTEDLATFYPTSVLVTGYEILYLWVARMIMSGLYLVGDVPFRQVVIHGLVRDRTGRKMSKSLGNVIDPLDMIEAYGADALRFALARMASPEQQNLPLAEEAIEAGRNFANKIWNAARLLLRAYPGGEPRLPPQDRRTVAERWLLSRHEACVAEVDAALERDEFAQAASVLHRFLWSELCDWGLEVEKGRLDGPDEERADAAHLLAWVLERTLRLLHPIMPFVTEEIWQRFEAGESIVVAPWPERHPEHLDDEAERSFGLVQEVVTSVRRFRSDHRVPPGVKVDVRVRLPAEDRPTFEALGDRIRRLALIGSLDLVTDRASPPSPSARIDLSRGSVWIPLSGLFDLEAEVARLRRDLDQLEGDLRRSEGKLANEGFATKASPSVVEAEREKADRLSQQRERIRAQIAELGADA
jgi:valyl-tRNA synthetase